MRIPPRFVGATVSGLDPKQMACVIGFNIRARVREAKGLLLSGPPGVGKTWALAALTQEYASWAAGQVPKRRADWEFVTAPDMFENLSEDFGNARDPYRNQTWLRTYSTVEWLVINDLGKEYRGGKLEQQVPHFLGRVLRARSEGRKVTHVTTNLRGAKLTETYGESVLSLMSEMMSFYEVDGRDRRSNR